MKKKEQIIIGAVPDIHSIGDGPHYVQTLINSKNPPETFYIELPPVSDSVQAYRDLAKSFESESKELAKLATEKADKLEKYTDIIFKINSGTAEDREINEYVKIAVAPYAYKREGDVGEIEDNIDERSKQTLETVLSSINRCNKERRASGEKTIDAVLIDNAKMCVERPALQDTKEDIWLEWLEKRNEYWAQQVAKHGKSGVLLGGLDHMPGFLSKLDKAFLNNPKELKKFVIMTDRADQKPKINPLLNKHYRSNILKQVDQKSGNTGLVYAKSSNERRFEHQKITYHMLAGNTLGQEYPKYYDMQPKEKKAPIRIPLGSSNKQGASSFQVDSEEKTIEKTKEVEKEKSDMLYINPNKDRVNDRLIINPNPKELQEIFSSTQHNQNKKKSFNEKPQAEKLLNVPVLNSNSQQLQSSKEHSSDKNIGNNLKYKLSNDRTVLTLPGNHGNEKLLRRIMDESSTSADYDNDKKYKLSDDLTVLTLPGNHGNEKNISQKQVQSNPDIAGKLPESKMMKNKGVNYKVEQKRTGGMNLETSSNKEPKSVQTTKSWIEKPADYDNDKKYKLSNDRTVLTLPGNYRHEKNISQKQVQSNPDIAGKLPESKMMKNKGVNYKVEQKRTGGMNLETSSNKEPKSVQTTKSWIEKPAEQSSPIQPQKNKHGISRLIATEQEKIQDLVDETFSLEEIKSLQKVQTLFQDSRKRINSPSRQRKSQDHNPTKSLGSHNM